MMDTQDRTPTTMPTPSVHRSQRSARQKYLFRAAFILTWALNEVVRTSAAGTSAGALPTVSHPALVQAVKFAMSAMFYFGQRRSWLSTATHANTRADQSARLAEEAVPLHGLNEDGRDGDSGHAAVRGYRLADSRPDIRVSRTLAIGLTLLASVLFTYYDYLEPIVRRLTGPTALYLVSSTAALYILAVAYAASFAVTTPSQWLSVLLLFSGFWIASSGLTVASSATSSLYPLVVGLIFSMTFAFSLMEFIYTRVLSISLPMLFMTLFGSGCLLDLVFSYPPSILGGLPALTWKIFLAVISKTGLDLMLLTNIYLEGALSTGVLLGSSAAVYLLAFSLYQQVYISGLLLGSSIVLIGAFTFFSHVSSDEQPLKSPGRLVRIAAVIFTGTITVYLAVVTRRATKVASFSVPARTPSLLSQVAAANTTCQRKPLQSLNYWPQERSYHAFDNVLLIVFFSHARYDGNLDYYQEVYSEFFPNIVFIGPGSREDLGFRHSYDVMVDTYEADEDLSDPDFYKMAGRMAHHMLYTAMDAHPCYDGYLWAPFDTLLNVPRLQQFDQNLVWYHSPFGQYVFNPALGDAAANADKDRHPPPANISPDPALNLTATWRHWGPDWWWGEPHVGVDVCMPAFNKVAAPMRAHLASLTDGTRFIGGSADTLYIPGRHRDAFLHVLGLFLETDCFLEIATPTALHLVSPPDEPILYVDHWWIWQPPFNADFVRQKWASGHEVDTFHTFHWGEKGDDGVWRSEPRHVEDVRHLFKESAARQGLPWP